MQHFITDIVFMALIITSVISIATATWLINGSAVLEKNE
jgi:hypothetical protein